MVRARALAVLSVVLALLAAPLGAETVRGQARVIDGDTLAIGDMTVRLHGIDAPELSQDCARADGRRWPCGQWAGQVLAGITNGQRLQCDVLGEDRYGRVVARCTTAGRDVAALMVAEGAAFAYRRYSPDYSDAEKRAAVAGIGLWQGDAAAPGDWRAASDALTTAPKGRCVIKGNISDTGRIFHMPGDESYARTSIAEAKGERWFCTEAEARAAGWRPARR